MQSDKINKQQTHKTTNQNNHASKRETKEQKKWTKTQIINSKLETRKKQPRQKKQKFEITRLLGLTLSHAGLGWSGNLVNHHSLSFIPPSRGYRVHPVTTKRAIQAKNYESDWSRANPIRRTVKSACKRFRCKSQQHQLQQNRVKNPKCIFDIYIFDIYINLIHKKE